MILNNVKSSNELKDELAKIIERKIRTLKEELVNIDYSIQWAKDGIIN